MKVKKCANGDYYVTRVPHGAGNKRKTREGYKSYRNWFWIKLCGGSPTLRMQSISFPKQFLGKKIRLKVEIIEEGYIC
jgi:hypothetical protein